MGRPDFAGSFLVIGLIVLGLGVTASSFVAAGHANGVMKGDAWSLSAHVHCSIYCPFLPLDHISEIVLTVEAVAGSSVTLERRYTLDNGTARTATIQGDTTTGFGDLNFGISGGGFENLNLVLIAARLGTGETIYSSTGTSSPAFNPIINGTVIRSYAGALREVNILTFPYGPNEITETVVWDQITGALLQLDLSDPGYGTGDSVLLTMDYSNMWKVSTAADFSIDSSSVTQSVIPGHTTTVTLDINSTNGLTGTINLSMKSPSALNAVLKPSSLILNSNGSAEANLTVTPSSNLSREFYVVNITVRSGSLVHYVALTILTTPPDFGFTFGSVSFPAGESGSTSVWIISLNGFNDTVTVQAVAPSAVVAGECSPGIVSVSSMSPVAGSQCTFYSHTPGAYQVNVTATSSSTVHSRILEVTVGSAPTQPDYYLSADPGVLYAERGSWDNTTITIHSVNGFRGNITLTAIGEPGFGYAYAPRTANLQSSSVTTTIGVSDLFAARGPYETRVLASNSSTFGALVRVDYLTVIVGPKPPPDFVIAANKQGASSDSAMRGTLTLTGPVGTYINSTIMIEPVYGFTGSVDLTVEASSGLTCSLSNARITGSGETKLRCSSNLGGTYSVTIYGQSGGRSRSINEIYVINSSPQPSSPSPAQGPDLVYVIIGGIVAAIASIAIASVVTRRRPISS